MMKLRQVLVKLLLQLTVLLLWVLIYPVSLTLFLLSLEKASFGLYNRLVEVSEKLKTKIM